MNGLLRVGESHLRFSLVFPPYQDFSSEGKFLKEKHQVSYFCDSKVSFITVELKTIEVQILNFISI